MNKSDAPEHARHSRCPTDRTRDRAMRSCMRPLWYSSKRELAPSEVLKCPVFTITCPDVNRQSQIFWHSSMPQPWGQMQIAIPSEEDAVLC